MCARAKAAYTGEMAIASQEDIDELMRAKGRRVTPESIYLLSHPTLHPRDLRPAPRLTCARAIVQVQGSNLALRFKFNSSPGEIFHFRPGRYSAFFLMNLSSGGMTHRGTLNKMLKCASDYASVQTFHIVVHTCGQNEIVT